MQMRNLIPPHLGKDLLASVVVFLVALPLCMGIAIASGVPPALGLITGIVGGIFVGTLSGAPLQVSGPAAGLTVLVFEIVRNYGIEMLGPVVFLAGILQFVAGRLRLGQWFRAVNPSVIHGMLAGIGVLIVASQFHIMLDNIPKGNGLANLISIPLAIYEVFRPSGWSTPHFYAGLTGLVTIIVMVGWDLPKRNPLRAIPAPLVAVVAGSALVYFGGLPVQKVSIPDSLWGVAAFPGLESFTRLLSPAFLRAVAGLAIIASAETLLSASALTKMRMDARVDYDKELAAQGLGNALCGLLGALPMTGVIVRSSANIKAGAQSRVSTIAHGLWLLLFVVAAPWLLRHISMASLAAVLVFTGYKLVNVQTMRSLAQYGRGALAIYALTLITIVVTDLLTGVLFGVTASLLRLVFTLSRLRIRKVTEDDGTVSIELRGAATVLTLPQLASTLEALPRDRRVALHLDRLFYIDHACMDLIETVRAQRMGSAGEMHLDPQRLRLRYHRSELRGVTPPVPILPRKAARAASVSGNQPKRRSTDFDQYTAVKSPPTHEPGS